MAFERWGSLSVADHLDTSALVANVLLYDRLVFPVMASQDDRNEREYWLTQGWNPDLQAQRLEDLGDLAIRRPWDEAHRQLFKSRYAELTAERQDAATIDVYGLTRRILAQDQVVERPPGVQHAHVIAAYNSEDSVRNDFQLTAANEAGCDENISAQAALISRRLAMPDIPNEEEALRLAVDLSRDANFRVKRSELFDWQERAIDQGASPRAIVDAISELSDAYNNAVKLAHKKVRWKLAFTICGVGLALAGGFTATAGISAAIGLVRFLMFDGTPAVEAGNAKPAAMFHDIEARLGAKLLAG